MNNLHGIKITDRDRVLRAWELSEELVKNYGDYAHETENNDSLARVFADFAEDEAVHATKLLHILRDMEKSNDK